MVDAKVAPDQALVAKMVAGDVTAFAALEGRMQDCVWTACLAAMSRQERLAREAFEAIWPNLAAASFRRCGAWSGKEPLETFLTIVARGLLLEWSAGLFQPLKEKERELEKLEKELETEKNAEERIKKDGEKKQKETEIERLLARATAVFEALFRSTIKKCVDRFHLDQNDRSDAHQEILVGLFANNCGRIRAYRGSGNFEAFVGKVVGHLLLDDLRHLIRRRHLPAAIERLSPLDQNVFVAIYWNESPADADRLFAVLRRKHPLARRADVEAAIKRVQKAVPVDYVVRSKPDSIDAPTPSGGTVGDTLPAGEETNPFNVILDIEDEELLQAAIAALGRAKEALTDDEDRICCQLLLDGIHKPQEIAKILASSVEHANVVKSRVQRRLKVFLDEDPDVTAWRPGDGEGE